MWNSCGETPGGEGYSEYMSLEIANKKAECCGCNACAEICPKHCITMVADAKGFLYPKVDMAVCVECGACEKVCPFRKENIRLNVPLKAFAAWNKDREKHISSSSGGAAYVLSEHIIRSGGIVYGCTSDSMHIRHIRIDKVSDLYKLQGSKYVQSDVCGLFSQVKVDLKAGLSVLFIGTPCQVAGLKNYIGHIPEHLYLVDLICHGVPSQQMLREHVSHVAKGVEVRQILFRKKNDIVVFLSADNFTYEVSVWREPYKDMYIKGFLDGLIYRPSCYRCIFARPERVSDITIGDFWGLQHMEFLPEDAEDGVSVLLPSTDKGLGLISAAADRLFTDEREVSEAVNGNNQLRKPVILGCRGRMFGCLYPTLPFDATLKLLLADRRLIRKIKDTVYYLHHVGD